jgi:hypothetical protein
MADKQFDRVVFNPRERPLSTDHNQMQSQLIRTINGTASWLLSDRSSLGTELPAFRTAFMGVSFFPYALGGMTITLAGGTGRMYDPTLTASNIGGIGGINDADDIYPLYLSSAQALSVPAADATNPRIDIIEVKVDRRLENPLTRDVFDPALEVFNPTLLNKTLTYDMLTRISTNGSAAINYKTGTPAGSPTAPAVTAGYVKIAEVYVGAGVTTIRQIDVADYRRLAVPGNVLEFNARVRWSSDSTAQNLTVRWGSASPGFRVALVSQNAVSGGVGQSAFLYAYLLHPNISGYTVSSMSYSTEGYLTGGHPINPNPVGNQLLPNASWNILNGTTAGYTAFPSTSFAGRNQPSVDGQLVAVTRSGSAWASFCEFDIHIKAMVDS